ncbi:MAG: PTPDL family protein [Luteolibacter sp.]
MKSIILTAAALLICQASQADIIFLKSGESIEGTILSEDAEKYIIQVNVTKSIKDEKTVAKADVKRVDRETADAKEFGSISRLVPAPDLLTVEEYAARIAKFAEFIETYPNSPLKKQAEVRIEELKAEMEVIEAGGAKMGGLIISPEEYAANAYSLDNQIAAKRINDAVGRRDFLSALRLFSEYEKDYSECVGRPEVVEKMQQVLAVYGASLQENLDSYDKRMEMRATGLERMSAEDRAQTQKALEEQQAKIDERFDAEKASQEKWITPDSNHKESLSEAMRQVESEMTRLESSKAIPAPETPPGQVYRETWIAVGSGDDESKKAALDVASRAKLPAIYLEKLTQRAGIAAD